MIIGGDLDSCSDKVYSTGFDVDATTLNMVVSGFIDATTTTSCSLMTDSNSGIIGFVTLINKYGKIYLI